uniref:Uncharacterized protein n=1 Tax=Alexandrium monilatum TaxID=311494 RepID=A0A7S4VMK4_9DINO
MGRVRRISSCSSSGSSSRSRSSSSSSSSAAIWPKPPLLKPCFVGDLSPRPSSGGLLGRGMQTTAESKAGPWTVKGQLHPTGVHAGAVQYAYSIGGAGFKSAKEAGVPTKGSLVVQIDKAKAKVKATLKARFTAMNKSAMKVVKKPSKK